MSFLFEKEKEKEISIKFIIITHATNQIVDRIVDVQLMMKSLHRQAKKCDTEEKVAKTKTKTCFKSGRPEEARIYAEVAVRNRKQSQHYQMLNASLSPVLAQLKDEFAGRSQECPQELNQLLHEVTAMGKKDDLNVTQNEINQFLQNIDNDQPVEIPYQSPTQNHLADLEQRLASLRRRSP